MSVISKGDPIEREANTMNEIPLYDAHGNPVLGLTLKLDASLRVRAPEETLPEDPPEPESEPEASEPPEEDGPELEDSDEDEAPAPEPEPEPEPLPDLEDAPPSIKRLMNWRNTISPVWYWNGRTARYERFQRLIVWQGDEVKVSFRSQSLAGGGGMVNWLGQHYTVLLDGHAVAEFPGDQGQEQFVTISLEGVSDGWHILDVASDTSETSVPYPVFVFRGAELPEQTWMPVFDASYGATSRTHYQLKWVPARFDPTPVPIPRREYPHFSHAAASGELWFEHFSPLSGLNRRPNIDKHGILNTCNTMWYNWSGVIGKFPQGPLLDGPRGVGCIGSPMHIEIGVATETIDPDSPPRRNLYVLDPWRICRVDRDGHITTLAGYRHKTPPSYWEEVPDLELIGDWSAIPEERRGFHELWGMAWDPRTLEVDPDAEPIHGRHPHAVGPTMYVTDAQNNRVCKIRFQPDQDDAPPVVTEFLTGLNDPWDIVAHDRTLIVSERQAHRIVQYDMDTGEQLEVLVEGAPLAYLNDVRHVNRTANLDEIQAEPVVAPEGLYIMDEWLYFGSAAMDQVKRYNLNTGEVEVVVSGATKRDRYIKIAVSDGTFGPRHTVFLTDWSVSRRGYPDAYLPSGKRWDIIGNPRYALPRGRNANKSGVSYSSAIAVRNGRMVCGSVREGLIDVSLATDEDPVFSASQYAEGRDRWYREGLNLLYGASGHGYFGLPLPWGFSEETDYYLRVHGHPQH